MKGAIFFTGKYGSTRQYADWLSEATHLPVFDLNNEKPDPQDFDFIVFGTSIIIMKPTISKWINTNYNKIRSKPTVLFTVSGAEPESRELRYWLEDNLPVGFMDGLKLFPLRGRLNLQELPWWLRIILKLGAKREDDPEVRKRMTKGFDYMDKSSIEPIVQWVYKMQSKESVMVE